MSDAGIAGVADALLRFRFAGTAGRHPLLVFENGWGASYEYWAWIERVLAPRARLLFYDRAGIGGSAERQPTQPSVAALSERLAALLAALRVGGPVVVVGHSYGGLVGLLHAIQRPDMVRAVIALDPSPDRDDALLDKQMGAVHLVAKLAILCARLGIPDPLFCPSGKRLPPPQGRLLVKHSFNSAPSLRGAVAELQLFGEIKARMADAGSERPQLIVSAGRAATLKGWAGQLFAPEEREREVVRRMQQVHRQRAALSRHGAWEELPFDHGSLVFSESGAAAAAARILDFLERLP